MGRKVYKVRLEIDEVAVQKRSDELDQKFITFCYENEIDIDDVDDPMFDTIMQSTLKAEVADRYGIDISMAVAWSIKQKGYVMIDGMEIESGDHSVFAYPVEPIRDNLDGDLIGCYLLVDDPDVATMLKLQNQ
ncbi:hypothetical protein [Shinella oryzae]|uniref:hypothetical protein n=1 Tax=Shinella oryzae TaxID=2871820 RepID=UPI001FF2CF63|nr:hypothetical protein [Shinella oryzae]UPA25350.1 hypothetical protein K6301_03870 [Shinella oryzae]